VYFLKIRKNQILNNCVIEEEKGMSVFGESILFIFYGMVLCTLVAVQGFVLDERRPPYIIICFIRFDDAKLFETLAV